MSVHCRLCGTSLWVNRGKDGIDVVEDCPVCAREDEHHDVMKKLTEVLNELLKYLKETK